jgi:hypothetical protein
MSLSAFRLRLRFLSQTILFDECGRGIWIKLYATFWGVLVVKNALKNIDDCI